jgi:CelD/BcsL family acetyltransferase involved in cellulose biosynthesis
MVTTFVERAPVNHAHSLIGVRIVGATSGLPAVEHAWRELFSASGNRSAMQLPEWMLTWWQIYSANREAVLIEFHDEGRLIGLAPLCRRLKRYGPGLSFQRLELMGAGVSEVDSVCGEYVGLLARPGYERRVSERFVAGLYNDEFGPWHECVLSMMDGSCPMTLALNDAFASTGHEVTSTIDCEALYVPLPATWDEYVARLGKKRRGWIKSTMTDFTNWCGESGYRLERATCEASLRTGLSILTDLHSRRWGSLGLPGAFDRPRFRRFHEVFAARLLAMGQLDLTWLTIDGVPWAVQYNFVTGGRVHFYQGGRRMDAPRRIGLGNVMIILAMQRAIERGDTEFDFLGGASEYKTRFATLRRPLTELRAARPGIREGALQTAKAAARSLRMLGHVVRPVQELRPSPVKRNDFRQARNVRDLS